MQNKISFYFDEDGDLKIEFSFDRVDQLTTIADLVLNGKVRNLCLMTIENKMRERGYSIEADYFAASVNKSIKPSEYTP
jgi:hypoxanthine-guanine phosphoribosyltransferase